MTMTSKELQRWLVDNSSGIYRPSAEAASYIDDLEKLCKKLNSACDFAFLELRETKPGAAVLDDLQSAMNEYDRLEDIMYPKPKNETL